MANKDKEEGLILISYDIKKAHIEVKEALQEIGYFDDYTLNKNNYKLPNTTLFHKKKTTSQAMTELKSICIDNSATLQKAVSTIVKDVVAYKAPIIKLKSK